MMRLTKSEMEIMTVLWEADHPLSRTEIWRIPRKRAGKTVLFIFCSTACWKRALWKWPDLRRWAAIMAGPMHQLSESQYAAQQIKSMSSYKKSQGQAMRCIFSALLDDSNVDDENPAGSGKKCCGIGVPK